MDEIIFDSIPLILEIPVETTGVIESISFDSDGYYFIQSVSTGELVYIY